MMKVSIDSIALLFTLGCLPLLILTKLPSKELSYVILGLSFLLLLICCNTKRFQCYFIWGIILLTGFLYSTFRANQYLSSIVPYIDHHYSVVAITKSVDIREKPKNHSSLAHYIDFSIQQINKQPLSEPIPIQLLWDKTHHSPQAGQKWALEINTKVVHGYLNEGGFDKQRFAIANRTLLRGKITKAVLIDDTISLRQKIINISLPYINLFQYKGVILALTFGERTRLEVEQKKLFIQTGIAHLLAISGMHIMLVATMGYWITRKMQYFLPNRLIVAWQPWLLGFIMAFFYAWLSGFNPPAIRAIIALALWIFFRYRSYNLSSWKMINRIIAIMLCLDPLMILSESFWLSCYCVISIVFLLQWWSLPQWVGSEKRWYIVKLLHLQLGLTLLLLPIQIIIFHGISSSALIANLIAIPLISIIIFPMILIALIMALCHCFYLSLWFWFIVNQSIALLFLLLDFIDWQWLEVNHQYYYMSIAGWIMIIIFRSGLWRKLMVFCALIIIFMLTPVFHTPSYRWRVDMLDVGHGLAMVIRQGKSAILYDTGAKWQNGSVAQSVILPFLQWHNLQVEGMIISHEHNDHIGGLEVIAKHYPDAWIMSSSTGINNDYLCQSGKQVMWGALKFTTFWPEKNTNQALNADSCVIQVTDGQFSVLLTGDLEYQQEQEIVKKYGKAIFSTALQTPHHGSYSSSSYAFLHHVSPQLSLISVSRYNPWKLPSNKVLQRYSQLGLPYQVTAKEGQISLFFYQNSWEVKSFRQQIAPKWYHDWFGSLTNYR